MEQIGALLQRLNQLGLLHARFEHFVNEVEIGLLLVFFLLFLLLFEQNFIGLCERHFFVIILAERTAYLNMEACLRVETKVQG